MNGPKTIIALFELDDNDKRSLLEKSNIPENEEPDIVSDHEKADGIRLTPKSEIRTAVLPTEPEKHEVLQDTAEKIEALPTEPEKHEVLQDTTEKIEALPTRSVKRRTGRFIFAVCIAALCIAGIAGIIVFNIPRNGKGSDIISANTAISVDPEHESLIKVSSDNASSSVYSTNSGTGESSVIKNTVSVSTDKTSDDESSVNEKVSSRTSSDESSEEVSKKQSSRQETPKRTETSVKPSEPSQISEASPISEVSPSGNEQKPDNGVSQSGAEIVLEPSANNTVTALMVVSEPSKKQYKTGEPLDLTGMSIMAGYDDGSSRTVSWEECMISGFDSSSEGIKNVTVSYGGRSFTIKLEVVKEASPDEVLTGKCGESLTYTFSSGILTISGKGEMFNYDESSPFADDMTVKSLIVENGVNFIGTCAFAYCGQLANAKLADTITIIDGYAFSECSALESIKLPSSLRHIGYCAFSGCSSLKEITLPEGLTSIEDNAFSGCISLEKIVIPESVVGIDPTAFDGCDKLTIYCKAESPAGELLKRYGIKYTAL